MSRDDELRILVCFIRSFLLLLLLLEGGLSCGVEALWQPCKTGPLSAAYKLAIGLEPCSHGASV